jgi:hypothetical protein
MQPLDRTVYGPLEKYFEQEVSAFQKNNTGRIINQYDVAKLLAPAYLKAATANNAVSEFRCAGLWPYNPNIFRTEEYTPALVTDGKMSENATAVPASSTTNSIFQENETLANSNHNQIQSLQRERPQVQQI